MTATKIILIRHGESKSTVARRIGGPRTCHGLSPLGVEQTMALRDRLADTGEITPDVVVTTGFPRAQETARPLAELWGLTPVVDPQWGEHDPGPQLDGMTFDEYTARYGKPDWQGDPDKVIYEGGETVRQFDTRIGAAFDATLAAYAGQTIVVVCHGGVIDRVFRRVMSLPIVGGFILHTLNTSITAFEEIVYEVPKPGEQTEWQGPSTPRWLLRRYNDAAHLAGLPEETPRAAAVAAQAKS